ncbi:PA14 domain-containing [Brachionus plicatilis]|uniref:PA14 domain-containing n=1 Tax=Brachionus plicatilis TaxID=10195 RepID=A0A3M7QHS5_BRAPC|nr:PA14 domain-containing [Brachionus plicatilis]
MIGNCICFDGYSGSSCEVLSEKFLDCASNKTEYAMNLADIPDWSTELTFVDLHRRARKWIAHKMAYASLWGELDPEDVQLSEDGYPIYLEIDKQIGTFMTRDLKAHYPNGKYVCLYDGDGYLYFWFEDVEITYRGAGRIEFTVTHKTEMNNGIYYNIIRTNPSNPIRNVRIMEAKFESTYQDFPFYPTYLEFLRKFKTLRFMPWSSVFEDVDVDWSNRTTDSFYTYTLRTGVSLEKQVLLCNTLGANPWFNLPHRASDNYIRKWAAYVRDNLRPDVKIYLEVGNECWGTGGSHVCGNYAQKMGYIQNYTIKAMQNYYSLNYQGQICYHAMTGKKYKDLIIEVFNETNQNPERINLIFGSQAAWTGPTEVFFLCNGDFYKSYDMLTVAPYMSASLNKEDESLVSLEEFYNTTVYEAIENAVKVTRIIGILVKNKTEGKMKFGLYEAGPDFSSLRDTSNTELTDLSFKIHRDPRMYHALKLYLTNLTKMPDVNIDVFAYFISAGVCSIYGCWGMIESSDANWTASPKYKAYMDHIDSEAICNWQEREYNCQMNCSSSGVCAPDPLTGKKEFCSCTFGSQGEYCEQPNYVVSERCTYECSGHGVCDYNHTEGFYIVHICHCHAGYSGYGCEIFSCTDNCNFNGKCVDNDTCSCFRGYKGKNCEIDCGCNNHGVCSSDSNSCICHRGYSFVNNRCELDCTVDPERTECLSCLDCGFGTCIRGSCLCWAGYTHDIRNSCTIPTRSANDGSKIGINLNGVVDYSPQWAFVDIGRMGREWIIQHMDKLNDLYIWNLNEKFDLTAERFPSSVPYERKFVTLLLRDMYGRWPDSVYHVEYDGEGDIEFDYDAQLIEHVDKNKMKISVKMSSIRDNGVFLKIHKINASNPIRNLRVVMDGFEDIHEKIPFHPLFMERLKQFKTIRFMPWTEEKNIIKWSQRITPTSYSEGNGVSFEHQVLLANLLKINPWFTVPYAADDNYVTEMAKLVLAQLRKDVTIYLEYTNEAWNDFFDSGKHCIEQGIQLGLSSDPVVARNLYYSKRSKEIIEIWKSIFGSEKDRIVLVLGSFTLMPIMSTRILEYQSVYLSHTRIMLAITGYIDCGSPSAAYVANSDMSSLFEMCDSDLERMNETIVQHLIIANSFNVGFGFYESGSGLSELSVILSGSETPGATDKYIEWNRDPRMYQVYKNYYNMFDKLNLTENCHYAYVGLASKYGSWHLLEHQNQSIQDAHRYRAIMEIIDETRLPVHNLEEITCDGILFNSSEVCDGLGICVSRDVCQPFKRPVRKSAIKISSLSGVGLMDNFYLSTDNWDSDLPLKYAYGIEHSEYGNVRLTDYIEVPTAVTILPYLANSFRIVLFVSDPKGSVFFDFSVDKVTTSRFDGDFAKFIEHSKNFTQLQNSVAMFDNSFNTSQLADSILGSFDLNDGDLDQTISNLDYYSSKFDKEPVARDNIANKFDDYFTTMEENIENGTFSSISSDQTSGLLNILSNIYEPTVSSKLEKLMSSFVKILTNMDNLESATGIAGISASNFRSSNLNMTVISIDTGTANLVNYSSIQIDALEIFASNRLGKVSLIDYPKDSSLSMVARQIDIKFFVNGTSIGVKNLTYPIKLNFDIDENTISTVRSESSKYKLVCKYYDEDLLEWNDSGCSLSQIDFDNNKVECSCTHATKFSILLEENLTIDLDNYGVTSSYSSIKPDLINKKCHAVMYCMFSFLTEKIFGLAYSGDLITVFYEKLPN